MQSIIIIGAGLAGYTVARELRKLDKDVPLTVITSCGGGFYSKPMLSNALAKNQQAAQLITQDAAKMAAQLNATVASSTHVLSIDTAGKRVETDQGSFEYGKLVIASGALPIKLNLQGDAADKVVSVNHVEDYAAFRALVDDASAAGRQARVAILGAGLIGCEFADDLAGAGHAVTLIDPNPTPLGALAAPALSIKLRDALAARGTAFRFGATATAVSQGDAGLRLALSNGEELECDVVLSAVGLRPDIRLAQAAGLKTDRGIVVDGMGQTSAADVYALGDCAEYMSDSGVAQVLPYVAPIMAAGRAIAKSLTGQPTPIDLAPTPVLVKTPSCPLALLPPPVKAVNTGRWTTETDDKGRTVCRFFDEGGKMIGFGVAPHDGPVRQALMSELAGIPATTGSGATAGSTR